jgi:hypothetical protein
VCEVECKGWHKYPTKRKLATGAPALASENRKGGKSLPSNRKGSSTPNGNNLWHKQSEFKSMKIQLRNKGLELENLHLRQKAEKTRATVQPTQGPTSLMSPSYAAAAGTQAPGVTEVLPLSERHPGGDPARPLPTTCSADINIMTWNVNKLAYTRELFLRQLLTSHEVDLMVLTEVELPRVEAAVFSLAGYNVHLPPEVDPVRVLVLVRHTHKIKARPDLSAPGLQMIWLELKAKMGKILIGGLYRQWHMGNASIEQSEFAAALDLVDLASAEARRVLVLGDINLDQHKSSDDTSYYRRALLLDLRTRMEAASLDYHPTPATHASYGEIYPSPTMELLGVKFDRQLSTKPYDLCLASAARQRANLIWRLTLYLPRGGYLRQIAYGLVIGKVGYAAAAVLRPRFDDLDRRPEQGRTVRWTFN